MFESIGLFKSISCPGGSNCSLLNCMFAHDEAGATAAAPIFVTKNTLPTNTSSKETTRTTTPIATPEPQDAEPLRKRRRIETPDGSNSDDSRAPRPVDKGKETVVSKTKTEQTIGGSRSMSVKEPASKLQSAMRKVSPPPIRHPSTEKQKLGTAATSTTPKPEASIETRVPISRQTKKETLNPRQLSKAPASHVVRMSILVKLHDAMARLNDQISKKETTKQAMLLSKDELITMALDEEEKAGKDNPGIYANVLKLRITKLRKMGVEEWEKEVVGYLGPKYMPASEKPAKKPDQPLVTGLSAKEEIAVASKIVTPLAGREQFGYVTSPPTEQDIDSARKGIEASGGWEKCDRCSGRFQVFPGRREDGALTTGGQCTYHYAKPFRPRKRKTDHITGQTEPYYPCCNETVGTSAGCTKADTHIFKVSEVKRLAAVLQFEETPQQPDKGALPPVCFDCEMGYTSLGMELIRLTAVAWPEGNELLDVLVRPMGEVLDLNSRYSGVRPEHFANAPLHGTTSASPKKGNPGEATAQTLQIADSPAAARELLFQHLQPETPLIGHAIDNDLNACRIIHPTIIDTVLLYPHPAGLPIRFSLKVLTKKYLDRDIQTGGDQGHDSKEDARATGDLVRVKIRETWKTMKKQGWEFVDGGKLVKTDGDEVSPLGDGGGVAVLGSGAGQKRKSSDET
ncbi:RNA exonuclease 3 [Arachnomyces sp. PD_36]|nr:RNA exonuclease 3 [Arachnomyces sp. PD_36]